MKLRDESGSRAVELRPTARQTTERRAGTETAGTDDDHVVIDAVVEDDGRSWALSEACLTAGEVRDLAAWLAGLAEDMTAGADEWTSLTFESDVLSMSGHRIPGGTLELRIALLRMHAGGTGTTDVVLGLRAPQADVTAAASALMRELSAFP